MNFRREVRMDLNKYFNAPRFDSSKSTHILRWQSEFEKRLMAYFDSDSKVKDYFQPLMSIIAQYNKRDYLIAIDFWVEYANGKVNLVHIERQNEFPLQSQSQILATAKDWLKLDGFGFITISDGNVKSVSDKTFNFENASLAINASFENFKWLN